MKTGFLFPGQGSRAVGMGRSLADACSEARAVFDESDVAIGSPFSSLCFDGSDEDLKLTENTQPALHCEVRLDDDLKALCFHDAKAASWPQTQPRRT